LCAQISVKRQCNKLKSKKAKLEEFSRQVESNGALIAKQAKLYKENFTKLNLLTELAKLEEKSNGRGGLYDAARQPVTPHGNALAMGGGLLPAAADVGVDPDEDDVMVVREVAAAGVALPMPAAGVALPMPAAGVALPMPAPARVQPTRGGVRADVLPHAPGSAAKNVLTPHQITEFHRLMELKPDHDLILGDVSGFPLLEGQGVENAMGRFDTYVNLKKPVVKEVLLKYSEDVFRDVSTMEMFTKYTNAVIDVHAKVLKVMISEVMDSPVKKMNQYTARVAFQRVVRCMIPLAIVHRKLLR
jgi:hypothetical protein